MAAEESDENWTQVLYLEFRCDPGWSEDVVGGRSAAATTAPGPSVSVPGRDQKLWREAAR